MLVRRGVLAFPMRNYLLELLHQQQTELNQQPRRLPVPTSASKYRILTPAVNVASSLPPLKGAPAVKEAQQNALSHPPHREGPAELPVHGRQRAAGPRSQAQGRRQVHSDGLWDEQETVHEFDAHPRHDRTAEERRASLNGEPVPSEPQATRAEDRLADAPPKILLPGLPLHTLSERRQSRALSQEPPSTKPNKSPRLPLPDKALKHRPGNLFKATSPPQTQKSSQAATPLLSPLSASRRKQNMMTAKEEKLLTLFRNAVRALQKNPEKDLEQLVASPTTRSGQFGLTELTVARMALPFVSSLCLRQHAQHPHGPWSINCAVLMLDICHYSSMTAMLAHMGPRFLNHTVNAALTPMFAEIERSGGDVLKFAGDAVFVIWATSTLADNVQTAAQTALALQQRHGEYQIPGMSHTFQFHMGIACGMLESHILFSKVAESEDFHYVSGMPLREACEASNEAQPGQVSVTLQSCSICPALVVTPGRDPKFNVLLGVQSALPVSEVVHHEKSVPAVRRFVNPHIYARLEMGQDLLQAEANRMLTMLFIACTGETSISEWFHMVQEVLDRHNCTILQVIDDDKGIHIVACFNFFIADPHCADHSVHAAAALPHSATGVAHGMSFCGLIGSPTACRWDVQGPPCVRACRLMEHAVQTNRKALFDQSVADALRDKTLLAVHSDSATLKGSLHPVQVWAPSPVGTGRGPARPLCSKVHSATHQQLLEWLTERVTGGLCPTLIINGMPGTGKRCLLLSVLQRLDVLLVTHMVHQREPQLAIVKTLAQWCLAQGRAQEVRLAEKVLEDLEQQQVQAAFGGALQLVSALLAQGLRTAFLISNAHFLDKSSVALIAAVANRLPAASAPGCFMQLITCSPSSGFPLAEEQFEQCEDARIVQIHSVPPPEARDLATFCLDAPPTKALMDALMAKSAGFVEPITAVCTYLRNARQLVTEGAEVTITPADMEGLQNRPWPQISATLTLKMFHKVDMLAIVHSTMMKVVASITAQSGITAFDPSLLAVTKVHVERCGPGKKGCTACYLRPHTVPITAAPTDYRCPQSLAHKSELSAVFQSCGGACQAAVTAGHAVSFEGPCTKGHKKLPSESPGLPDRGPPPRTPPVRWHGFQRPGFHLLAEGVARVLVSATGNSITASNEM